MKIEDGNKLIAEFMGFPKVTKLSFWDYDRSLDNASMIKGLCVEDINEQGVKFYEKMPYERYGLSYFDGIVFKPIGFDKHGHSPNKPYHTSWDWLMSVVEKIENLGIGITKINVSIENDSCRIWNYFDVGTTTERFKLKVYRPTKIEAVHEAVIQFIIWHNRIKFTPAQVAG